jgi:excisionase family DNA binding protein
MRTSPIIDFVRPEQPDLFDRLHASEKLLTAKELAAMLAISEKTIYSYVARNMIPHYRIEANVRFRARDIAAWLRLHEGQVRLAGPMSPKRAVARPL